MATELREPTFDEEFAKQLADSLPDCDDEAESDLISLCDIVVTGIETDWQQYHFRVRKYVPGADGTTEPWAIVEALPSGLREGEERKPIDLTAAVVRQAVERYALDMLKRGTNQEEVAKMMDGSYTDAPIADAVLQFAIYGEVVFS